MFYTYIIQSVTTRKHYIGSTENINKRLDQHNSGKTKSIKNNWPFVLIYSEVYNTRQEAYRREKEIKSYKGGNAFRKLLSRDTQVVNEDRL